MKLPSGTQEIPLSQVKEKAKVDRLRTTEADYHGQPGYERYHLVEQEGGSFKKVLGEAPDGSYKWRYQGRTAEVTERLAPWIRADSERQSKLQGAVERTKLTDEAGSAHYVPTSRAEEAERRNGWRRRGHRIRVARAVEDRRYSVRCSACGEFPYWCECDQ